MRMAVLAATALALAAPASAQVSRLTRDYKVVEHGRSIKLDAFGSYDPDCRAIGRATINLTSAAQGGTVETGYGRDYPRFSTNNVRFHCDRQKLPATLLYYRASPSFTGADTFTIEVVFGTGEARQLRYTVYVR